MKALICGINGQDGSYLARLLIGKGYEVWGTSRDVQTSSLENLKSLGLREQITLISMAPSDFRSVFNAIDRSDPDEIYYLSGQSSVALSFEQPAETLESIVTGILNVLEVIRLRKKPVKLYNAGSSECFGDTGGIPADECTLFQPKSPYAVAKASAHWLVANYRESYGLYGCTGILFNHESPLRPNRFVTQKIIQSAKRIAAGSKEQLVLGRLDIQRDWGWAPEYVDAMWRMLQLQSPVDLVIATGETNSLESFVKHSFAIYDIDWREHVKISEKFERPSDILFSSGDSSKAERLLHWEAHFKMNDVIQKMSFETAETNC